MTTQEIITLAKEKLDKDITEQEAQDYIDGKAAIPDEALDIVSGGSDCGTLKCFSCGSTNMYKDILYSECLDCGYIHTMCR